MLLAARQRHDESGKGARRIIEIVHTALDLE